MQYLKGVGPKRAADLSKLGIQTARDLLYHVPRRHVDATEVTRIGELGVGDEATVIGTVASKGIVPTRSGLRIFQAIVRDRTGMITAAWPGQPYLDRKIRKGDKLLILGKVKFFHGKQLQSRDFTVLERDRRSRFGCPGGPGGRPQGVSFREGESEAAGPDADGTIFVTYPTGKDVPQWILRDAFRANLSILLEWADDDEFLSAAERATLGLPGLSQALRSLHRPSTMDEIEAGRRRLAFDELFFLQIVQARARRETARDRGVRHSRDNSRIKPVFQALPFELTDAQTRVLREISDDMTSPRRMNRLLQGDVGSGKTVVALFAMLIAVESGRQGALMAPTELLAEQHARSLRKLLEPTGIRPTLLTGRLGAPARREALVEIEGGAPVIVGTHALLQESVNFSGLGLVVVDEQHRFGVRQRLSLTRRGGEERPDLLVMSATPIPRSLAMVLYGELDVSVIDELPKGRRPIETRLAKPRDRKEIYRFIDAELEAGRQAYIVYPIVAQSEELDLRAAEDEYERLADTVFEHRKLALLHGQLHSSEKDDIMRDFLAGRTHVLVATTVIEVGIDVANATVMVIEHAERFGLSQLHQLRGRVGRGATRSHCILVAGASNAGAPRGAASRRLDVLVDTQDGFRVAEQDLEIRGEGDLFGSDQHGRRRNFRFADLTRDLDLVEAARSRAGELIARDPDLRAAAHVTLRQVLEARYGEKLELYRTG